jgi:hypothetical protein
LSLRGKHLVRILHGLLASSDRREELLNDFIDNPIYKQLSGAIYGKLSPPSYIPSSAFRSILVQLIASQKEGDSFRAKIEGLPDETLKATLIQLWDEGNQRFDLFVGKVEIWYDQVMERSSGWYKRNIQKGLLVIGLIIGVIFNVDILTIYDHLIKLPRTDLEQLTALAQTVTQQNKSMGMNLNDSIQSSVSFIDTNRLDTQTIYELINSNIQNLKNPLGIGWGDYEPTNDILFWLFKIFGWLITAICISKGAPFWFDLLKGIVNFRDSGPPPLPSAVSQVALADKSTVILAPSSSRNEPNSWSTEGNPVG